MMTSYGVAFASAVVPSVDSVVITSGLAVVPVCRVRNVVPPSVEYWYFVIGLPPSAALVKLTESVWLLGVIVLIVGALGVVRGVALTLAEAAPLPTAFTARSCTG